VLPRYVLVVACLVGLVGSAINGDWVIGGVFLTVLIVAVARIVRAR
jgi:hypothetical protein